MKRAQQKGFNAAIVLVAVTVVAVAGFIAWRIYDANQQPNQASQTQQTNNAEPQAKEDPKGLSNERCNSGCR